MSINHQNNTQAGSAMETHKIEGEKKERKKNSNKLKSMNKRKY